jgi:hypothetical protein
MGFFAMIMFTLNESRSLEVIANLIVIAFINFYTIRKVLEAYKEVKAEKMNENYNENVLKKFDRDPQRLSPKSLLQNVIQKNYEPMTVDNHSTPTPNSHKKLKIKADSVDYDYVEMHPPQANVYDKLETSTFGDSSYESVEKANQADYDVIERF